MSNEGALAKLDQDAIIERIASGEYASHIAPELGVTKQALHYQIRKHPRYREAREMGWELRMDNAMAQFDKLGVPRPPLKPLGGPDPEIAATQLAEWKQAYQLWKDELRCSAFDLARVESYFKSISWQAEREFPERWGQRQQTNINIDLGSALQLLSERIQERNSAVQQTPVIEGKTLDNQ